MILIKNGHVLDPKSGLNGVYDILIKDGRIIQIKPFILEFDLSLEEQKELQTIYADNMMIAPGLVDVHSHFRDPGLTYKEDIYTGALAAAKGGYTTVVLMANTKPTVDNEETLQYVIDKANETAIHVLTCASITKGLKGNELTDMTTLTEKGAVGFTDDGIPLMDEAIVIAAMKKAKELNVPLSFHEENPGLITNNGINHGEASEYYDVIGSPRAAEIDMIYRDLELAKQYLAPIDIQHISTKEGVELLRQAKHDIINDTNYQISPSNSNTNSEESISIPMETTWNINIHGEATPHHFS